jgi:hypothetical protein
MKALRVSRLYQTGPKRSNRDVILVVPDRHPLCLNADLRPTLPVVRGWVREIMGLLYVIHNRQLLHTLDSFRRNAPLRR